MLQMSGLERARSALEKGVPFPSGSLLVPIARSWERCVGHGLVPTGEPESPIVGAGELGQRRERNGPLRRLAIAEMQVLHAQIAGSNVMIAFADPDGVVLDTVSDQVFAESSAGRSIIPGSVWGERERGTNALGLAVIEGQPVVVHGREHYFACHGHLSCMAAPIHDARGALAGVLDASCSNEARQQHTHALVRMAATHIENGLIFQGSADLLIFAFHPRAEYLDTLSAGLVALSRDGEVRSLNRQSRGLLAGLAPEIGSRFEDLFDARFDVAMTNLLGGGVLQLRDRAGSGVLVVCRQIGQRGAPTVRPRRRAAAVAVLPEGRDVGFVCDDPVLRRAMHGLPGATARRMAVHIHGDTGTGKELMARHVHAVSGRDGPFVAVNCGAIPESLFVAELFGHDRGAFTNARSDGAPGLARLADGGTLFLDEVAEIPFAAQTALLRFLDTKDVRAIGGQKAVTVDVQVVSATNRDLEQAVARRAFRADLYFRLSAFAIALPPLRDRADFAAVVRHLMATIAPEMAITDEAVAALRARAWPGNIRELHAALQRAVISTEANFLDETAFEAGHDARRDVCADCGGHPLNGRKCRQIRDTYRATGNNIAEAARLLGVSRNTVYKHIR